MNDDIKQLESFKIIGISVRTTNENKKALNDISQLWNDFFSKNIPSLISNKVSDDIYSVYTDYESDYTGAYTVILGYKVDSIENIPDGLSGKEFDSGKYIKYTIKGKIPDIILDKWKEIWHNEDKLNRKYAADFEVYSEKSQNPEDAEIDIYISVK